MIKVTSLSKNLLQEYSSYEKAVTQSYVRYYLNARVKR